MARSFFDFRILPSPQGQGLTELQVLAKCQRQAGLGGRGNGCQSSPVNQTLSFTQRKLFLGGKAGGRLPAHDETQNSRVAIDDFPKELWD